LDNPAWKTAAWTKKRKRGVVKKKTARRKRGDDKPTSVSGWVVKHPHSFKKTGGEICTSSFRAPKTRKTCREKKKT